MLTLMAQNVVRSNLALSKQFRLYSICYYAGVRSFYTAPKRSFGLPKYNFDDEEWEANRFQVPQSPTKQCRNLL